MKTLRFARVFYFLLIFAACPSAPAETGPGSGPVADATAIDYFRDNKLTVGWNLGNSLDAHQNGKGGETNWGNPAINQALLNGVKAAGFNLLRLPVTWMGHIGDAPSYTIDPARLARVAEVVDMAHNAGLVVIINLHHDGATQSKDSEAGWLSINKSLAKPADKAAITAKFTRVWEQIADQFKDYDNWLIFEGFNELHDGGWYWAQRNVPQNQYDLVNEWNQVFTNTVRKAGGKNANRFLVIPGYCTGPEALLNANFKLPTDSASGRQIVSFHYYRPDDFALNGKVATWGTSSEKSAIDSLFGRMKTAFIDKNIPVIIGETGPVKNNANTDQARQSRIAYAAYMFGKAKENGLVPVYWDNGVYSGGGEKFGLFNRNTGQPFGAPATTEYKDCIDAMINATK